MNETAVSYEDVLSLMQIKFSQVTALLLLNSKFYLSQGLAGLSCVGQCWRFKFENIAVIARFVQGCILKSFRTYLIIMSILTDFCPIDLCIYAVCTIVYTLRTNLNM